MTQDLGKLNFAEAQKACADLGFKKDEFKILCSNKDKIGFTTSWYWTSSEFNREAAGFDMSKIAMKC